ncbi:VanZ family protein [Lysinibacillus sp. KU-BSD001]|uniref:VanZ family protein n=1 Tax=Lysinibacillus sp. KU-BSD001 TaxID=3141328 RepID=UPI0036EE9B9B
MKKYIFLVVLALTIVGIMSNMTYEQQTIVPELREILADEPFKEQLSHIEITYWNRPISVETRGYVYFIEFLIRKATHFAGYGIIGVLFFLLYRKLNWRFPTLFAILSIFFIASIDEIRQSFLPGRTGLFDDVMIDTVGAIVFVALAKIILSITKRVSSF